MVEFRCTLKFHNKIWLSIKLNKRIIIIYIVGWGLGWIWGWSRWSDWSWSRTSHHSIWISLWSIGEFVERIFWFPCWTWRTLNNWNGIMNLDIQSLLRLSIVLRNNYDVIRIESISLGTIARIHLSCE